MPLNKECIGKTYPSISTTVTLEALQKYARAYNDDNRFFFEPQVPGGIVVPPMFGVTFIWQSVMSAVGDPAVRVDLLRLLHGEQDMEFPNPVGPGDVITATSKIRSIETKATGETMVVEIDAANQKGEAVQHTLFTVFIRSAGSGKGDSETRPAEPPRGEPLHTVAQKIDEDQTYRYAEASGDRNPIHVDANVAKMAGLPGIIVHGLCTMAFTSKVVIDKLCAGDPRRLRRLKVRFARPVLPGQTIVTKIWRHGGGPQPEVYDFETFNRDGKAVIREGLAEVLA